MSERQIAALKETALKKIEVALSEPLNADLTAMYIQAFALLTANTCNCKKDEVKNEK